MKLQIDDKAPDFELKDQDGKSHKLSDYKGKKIVLYFYPRDDTPGCTKEACDFRDNYGALKKKALVIGVSADDEKSHKKFVEKYSLPFILLSDPDKKVLNLYGVWGKKSFIGKTYMGIIRTTFIIDKSFKIKKIFPKVSVEGHVQEIIKALE
jgi:thioredoxin-dependent peroxiredoxin